MPPLQTIRDSLTILASNTATELEDVWDEVGYTPEERASQLSDLLTAFRNLCEDKVAEERGVAEQFQQTISEHLDEIQRTSKALKKEVDLHSLEENYRGLSLTDALATLEVSLESLRADANDALADICDCRDELVDAHAALGKDIEEEWLDVSSDLTLERRDQFHRKVEAIHAVVETRRLETVQLLKECQHLMQDLHIDPDENPFDQKISGSLIHGENTVITIASNIETDTCTGISEKVLHDVTKRIEELNIERRRRKDLLGKMGNEIGTLWEKLHVSEEEQRAFAESVKGLGMDTIAKGEEELKRLHILKARMIGKLIIGAREEIRGLWYEIGVSEEHQSTFESINVTDETLYTDDLLSEHEEYVEALNARLEQMRPILRLIEKREEIIEERMKYEKLQKDPERLQQRGPSLTKQLMKEEKMARRIKKDLPKYTDLLVKKLKEWQDRNGNHFTHNGKAYYDLISKQEKMWRTYKDTEMQQKLKKKQEEKAHDMDRANERWGKPLPGKKKVILTTNKATNGPLSDACNKTNVMQEPSVDHVVYGGIKGGTSKRAVSADPRRIASADPRRIASTDSSYTRAVSRSRAQSSLRGGASARTRHLTRP